MFKGRNTAQKIKDFFSKCDQIRNILWIWSHLLKKSSMENLVFCTVKESLKQGIADVSKVYVIDFDRHVNRLW